MVEGLFFFFSFLPNSSKIEMFWHIVPTFIPTRSVSYSFPALEGPLSYTIYRTRGSSSAASCWCLRSVERLIPRQTSVMYPESLEAENSFLSVISICLKDISSDWPRSPPVGCTYSTGIALNLWDSLWLVTKVSATVNMRGLETPTQTSCLCYLLAV